MTIELEQYDDDKFNKPTMEKISQLYDLGFPSDIVPYDERSQAFDTCICKLRKSDIAEVSIRSNLNQPNTFYCKVRHDP